MKKRVCHSTSRQLKDFNLTPNNSTSHKFLPHIPARTPYKSSTFLDFYPAPGHSTRSLQKISSSSSAEKRSTRTGTWPQHGSGRRSACGTEAGSCISAWAGIARPPCTPAARSREKTDRPQREHPRAAGPADAEPPPPQPDLAPPRPDPVESTAVGASQPRGRGRERDHQRRGIAPPAQVCRPPITAPAQGRRGLLTRFAGAAPPPCWSLASLKAQAGPLERAVAALQRRKPAPPPSQRPLRPRPQASVPPVYPRTPVSTHGARRLHGAASSAARRKGKAACTAASRHPPAGSPAPGRPLRPLARRRALLEEAAVSLRSRRPALGSGPAGAACPAGPGLGPTGGGSSAGPAQRSRGPSPHHRGRGSAWSRSEEPRPCVTPGPAGSAGCCRGGRGREAPGGGSPYCAPLEPTAGPGRGGAGGTFLTRGRAGLLRYREAAAVDPPSPPPRSVRWDPLLHGLSPALGRRRGVGCDRSAVTTSSGVSSVVRLVLLKATLP